jgi:hypothetical protein
MFLRRKEILLAVLVAALCVALDSREALARQKGGAAAAAVPAVKDEPTRLLGASEKSVVWTKEDVEMRCHARYGKGTNTGKECMDRGKRLLGRRMTLADIQEIAAYKLAKAPAANAAKTKPGKKAMKEDEEHHAGETPSPPEAGEYQAK